MTSRERVQAALEFREADRVPIDWGMITISGIHETAYRNLLKLLKLEETVIISDPVQRLALPSEAVLQWAGSDTRVLWANAPASYTYREDAEGGFVDEFGISYRRVGAYCDFDVPPLANAETISDLRAFKLPDPADPSRFAGLRARAKDLYFNTDKALVGGNLASLYYCAWGLRGYQNFMMDTAADPAFSNYLLDMLLDWWMAFMDAYLAEIGDFIQIMWAGDDWGSQSGPLIAPDDFRANVVPRFKKLISAMKRKSNAKLAYHSCGSAAWALDDFVEMGVDILHPLQANAAGNEDAKSIKALCHGRLVIHGGLDNQGKFRLGESVVEDDVREKIAAFAPGGGYLFSSGHNIQGDCPAQNIATIFNTHKQAGRYTH